MQNVTHKLVAVEKPTIEIKRNTIRRTRQLDGQLVHQYVGWVGGYPQTFNTDGTNWWRVVTAVKDRKGHVHVFA